MRTNVIRFILLSLFIIHSFQLDSVSDNTFSDQLPPFSKMISLPDNSLFQLTQQTNLFFTSSDAMTYTLTSSSSIPQHTASHSGISNPFYLSSNEIIYACTRSDNNINPISIVTLEPFSITSLSLPDTFPQMLFNQQRCGLFQLPNGNLGFSYLTSSLKAALAEFEPINRTFVSFSIAVESGPLEYSTYRCIYMKRIDKIICDWTDCFLNLKTSIQMFNSDFTPYTDDTFRFPMSITFSNEFTYMASCSLESINDDNAVLFCFSAFNSHSIYYITAKGDTVNELEVYSDNSIITGGSNYYNFLPLNENYFIICITASNTNESYIYLYNVNMRTYVNTPLNQGLTSSYSTITFAYNENNKFIFENFADSTSVSLYEFDMFICSNDTIYILNYDSNEINFDLLYNNTEKYLNVSISFFDIDEISDASLIDIKGVIKGNDASIDSNYESIQSGLTNEYSALRYTFYQGGPFKSTFVLKRIFNELNIPSTICEVNFEYGCYESCSSCSGVGNETNHLCLTCQPNFYFLYNTSNCYDTTPSLHFLDNEDSTYKQCIEHCDTCHNSIECDTCTTGYEMLSHYSKNENDLQCVKYCDVELSVWYIDNENGFTCLKGETKCPYQYPYLNEITGECTEQCESSQCEMTVSYELNSIVSEMNNDIKFYYENNITTIHKEKEFTAYFYTFDEIENKTNSSLPLVILNNTAALAAYYNISKDDIKYVSIISLYNENYPTEQIEYAFYTSSGEYLNLSLAKVDNVTVISPIKSNDDKLFNMTLAKRMMLNISVDVFDTEDEFFNNFCDGYGAHFDTDITVNDRRNEFFQNVSLCDDNCEYKGFDPITETSNCLCKPKSSISTQQIIKTIENSFTKPIKTSNIKVISCYKKVFSKDLVKNYGFWIMIFFFGIQLANAIYIALIQDKYGFLFVKASPIIVKKTPPKVTIYTSSHLSSSRTNRAHVIQKEINNVNIINMNNNNYISSSHSKILPNYNEKNYMLSKEKYNDNASKSNFDEEENTPKDNIESTINFEFIGYSSLITITKNINWLNYCTIVMHKHPILSIFFISMPKMMKCLRISLFLSSISISLAMNAMFYSDSYISENYHSQSFYDLLNELPKVIYSLFFGCLLNIIFKVLIAMSPIKKGKNDSSSQAKLTYKKFLLFVKIKISLFFILIFICNLFFIYLVSAFCAVYSKSVVKWSISAGITLAFALFLPFVISAIIFALRRLAVAFKNRCFFGMSEVMSYV